MLGCLKDARQLCNETGLSLINLLCLLQLAPVSCPAESDSSPHGRAPWWATSQPMEGPVLASVSPPPPTQTVVCKVPCPACLVPPGGGEHHTSRVQDACVQRVHLTSDPSSGAWSWDCLGWQGLITKPVSLFIFKLLSCF